MQLLIILHPVTLAAELETLLCNVTWLEKQNIEHSAVRTHPHPESQRLQVALWVTKGGRARQEVAAESAQFPPPSLNDLPSHT